MARTALVCATLVSLSLLGGCLGDSSNELAIPRLAITNGGTAEVSNSFANLGGVPEGVQVVFIGDVIVLRGIHFRPNMKFFLGMNIDLARRPNSIFTTDRHLLPDVPFVFEDPISGQRTILEVEAPVEYSSKEEIRVTIPPAVACSPAFTNPIVRMYGDDGSSEPVVDVFHVVGPRCIALTPSRGPDIGGFDVIVHGDFLSPYTQVAIRFPDPVTGETRVIGDTASTDIAELFIDRFTLVIPDFPGVVPNSTLGLAEELEADVLLFESIDDIVGRIALEPNLDGVSPCDHLRPESPEAQLFVNGVRNSEKSNAFTFLPTGVTDFPSIAGIVPEFGPEIGGNTVIVQGDQFDAFSADISDPNNPGIGIECPPDSGNYIPPLEATLVDRQTLVIEMPPCPVDIPETVNFCIRNKFSIDRPNEVPSAGPNGDCVIFEDIYTYQPIPPIVPPIVTSIFPVGEDGRGCVHDYGLERIFVVGDWFDGDTELNGGFELLLPNPDPSGDPIPVQSVRTILHNRNLIEVFTPRLPDEFYPLTEDVFAGVRVRNVVGHADFEDVVRLKATPDDPDTPSIDQLCGTLGPLAGGNEVVLLGSDFDTSTQVFFGATEAADVQFLSSGILVATAPAGATPGDVSVTANDDGAVSNSLEYTYVDGPVEVCPVLALLTPDSATSTGGASLLAYGANLTPTTRVEFGVGSGNLSFDIFFVDSKLLRVEVPEALKEQVGLPIPVGATDPLQGCDDVLKTVDFTFVQPGDAVPEILFVDTTVEVPVNPQTDFPALNVGGMDRMLVIGRNFDQNTTFDLTKGGNTLPATSVRVLDMTIAVMTAPASPDGDPGVALLQAHNAFGDSNEFEMEYVQPGPPAIFDVRNLDDGTTTAPIDANDRLIIFGDNFIAPFVVTLRGCDPDDPSGEPKVLTFTDEEVTVVEDHLIGLNIPANTFCQGALDIEVDTEFGDPASFSDEDGPIFRLIGPQPPLVAGVFPSKFKSAGGEEAVFFGRFFTPTTEFSVRTDATPAGAFQPVMSQRFVSETVAIVTMPPLDGAMPPGAAGDVRAEETDGTLRAKIIEGSDPPIDPFTISSEELPEEVLPLFRVCLEDGPRLVGVFPDHGFIDGCEQVLLLGDDFLTADGSSNIAAIRFFDEALGMDIGTYTEAAAPIDSLDPEDKGKFIILNNHEILLITNPHPPIDPEDINAPVNVIVESDNGSTTLVGGYTYINTPAVRTPLLLGITPNETRVSGGTSHLISGGFLTEADRIVFTKPDPGGDVTFTLDSPADFSEVSDTFLVFVMPDLSGAFAPGDVLDVHAEKDVDGTTLVSNTLFAALRVTFEGPPFITPELDPNMGSAFGGDIVEITGGFFTSNSRVLFGTIPAPVVVPTAPDRILVITPSLPVFAPEGTDLTNIPAEGHTVDIAVFNQGGWAVLPEGYLFKQDRPVVDSCAPEEFAEDTTAQVTVHGANFVPGETTATPLATGGTVTDLVVHDFHTLTFTYESPVLPPGADPFVDMITIATNHGVAADTCDLTTLPDPEFRTDDTRCTTTYTPNTHASPTTGVFESDFVVVTLKGSGFMEHGSLGLRPRTAILPIALEEIGAMDAFTKQGQFRVVDSETMEFSAPNVFPSQSPTLLQGNPNVGLSVITYTSPGGRSATLDDCFRYVPTLADFEEYGYPIPNVDPSFTDPDKLTSGDINGDGVPDVVALARQFTTELDYDEVFVFIADTFGDIDVDGDGKKPDFAGTFTRFVLEDDDLKTNLFTHGRGSKIRLANLDGDDALEIIVPGSGKGPNHARVAIFDVAVAADGTVSFPSTTVLIPTAPTESDAVSGIAVGNFDSSHAGPDIAIAVGSEKESERMIVVFGSTGTAFTFTQTHTDIDDPFDDYRVGFLEKGNFDDDAADELIWSQAGHAPNTIDEQYWPVVVADVDASTAKVTSQKKVTNFTGGAIWHINVFDADKDGKDDAFLLVIHRANGSFFGDETQKPGIAVLLDPSGLGIDAYHETGFLNDGPTMACADFNADGEMDLAPHTSKGKFTVFFGDGKGKLIDSERTWILVSAQNDDLSRVHGVAAADLNRDGIAELFMGDTGLNPKRLVVFLNTSR